MRGKSIDLDGVGGTIGARVREGIEVLVVGA